MTDLSSIISFYLYLSILTLLTILKRIIYTYCPSYALYRCTIIIPRHRQNVQCHTDDCQSRPPAEFCESPAKPWAIYDPLPNDMLLGRGIPIEQRPRNLLFRKIDMHKDKCIQGKRNFKHALAACIAHFMKQEGGQFLKELEDGKTRKTRKTRKASTEWLARKTKN
jgi:hypothetical protein